MPAFLPVVLLAEDVLRRLVLGGVDAGPFLPCHDAIGLGLVLHGIDMLLLLFQFVCFTLCELSTPNPLIDALLLIRLPLVDARSLSLSIAHSGRQ